VGSSFPLARRSVILRCGEDKKKRIASSALGKLLHARCRSGRTKRWTCLRAKEGRSPTTPSIFKIVGGSGKLVRADAAYCPSLFRMSDANRRKSLARRSQGLKRLHLAPKPFGPRLSVSLVRVSGFHRSGRSPD